MRVLLGSEISCEMDSILTINVVGLLSSFRTAQGCSCSSLFNIYRNAYQLPHPSRHPHLSPSQQFQCCKSSPRRRSYASTPNRLSGRQCRTDVQPARPPLNNLWCPWEFPQRLHRRRQRYVRGACHLRHSMALEACCSRGVSSARL